MAACIANAAHIGVDVKTALCGKPGTTGSPFFSASLTNIPLSLDTITTSYRAIEPDLRPCAAQITQDHPLYIDVFPFPTLRKRILAIRACADGDEKVFDEEGFTHDIDNGGVVCWGADSRVGPGVPWDSRSWEFQGWFLRKWWMLTGGVEGELGKQVSLFPAKYDIFRGGGVGVSGVKEI